MLDPVDDFQNYDYTVQGPGFLLFFSTGIEHGAGFDFPDRPPSVPEEEEKQVLEIINKVIKADNGLEARISALKAALDREKIVYKQLYIEWLKYEIAIKKQKKRKRNIAIRLLLADS